MPGCCANDFYKFRDKFCGFCIRQPSHQSVSLSEFRNMGKKRQEFGCFSWFGHGSKSRVVNSEFDPVLLVPGIVGSILDAVNKKDGSSERVWVQMLMASCEFKKKLWAIYNPETGE